MTDFLEIAAESLHFGRKSINYIDKNAYVCYNGSSGKITARTFHVILVCFAAIFCADQAKGEYVL